MGVHIVTLLFILLLLKLICRCITLSPVCMLNFIHFLAAHHTKTNRSGQR